MHTIHSSMLTLRSVHSQLTAGPDCRISIQKAPGKRNISNKPFSQCAYRTQSRIVQPFRQLKKIYPHNRTPIRIQRMGCQLLSKACLLRLSRKKLSTKCCSSVWVHLVEGRLMATDTDCYSYSKRITFELIRAAFWRRVEALVSCFH